MCNRCSNGRHYEVRNHDQKTASKLKGPADSILIILKELHFCLIYYLERNHKLNLGFAFYFDVTHQRASCRHFRPRWLQLASFLVSLAAGGRQHVSTSIQTQSSQCKDLIIFARLCIAASVWELLNVAFDKLCGPFCNKLTNWNIARLA